MKRRLLLFVIICLSVLSVLAIHSSPSLAATPAAIQGLHVVGNKIVNAAGQNVRLLGVNRSGGEYMCVQGRGIFDGPVDATSIQYMLDWKINAVRIPMNEDCWLAINGVNAAYAGANYQQAMVNYVNLLNSMGLVAILDLHWGAPGTTLADKQSPMPDLDHTPAFWQSVANTFKGNSSVIFDLFNEPYPDNNSDSVAGWTCWRDGGTCAGVTYPVAGFQSLVNTVRATGATNVIIIGGLEYSNALTQWLTYKPTDPTGNLAASWHIYNFNLCAPSSCWTSQVQPVLQQVPLVAGEIGENDCAHTFIDPLMSWLDTNGASYLAWTWDAWGICASGPVLINDYLGNPTAFGQGFKDHLSAVVAGATVTPLPPPTVGPGVLQVAIKNGNGDNTQQTDFRFNVTNNSGWPVSNISVRIYYTADGTNPGTGYVMEGHYDQSGVATISGPTLASGNIYYFSVNYGTTGLGAGGSWEFQAALHLGTWGNTYDGSNDWYHTGYAVGALPAAYTNTNYIPAYVNGALAWGQQPGSGTAVPSNTPTKTNTATNTSVIPSNTPTTVVTATNTPTKTNTPTITATAFCPQATAVPGPAVDPVISPTSGLTQVINVAGAATSWTKVSVDVTVGTTTTTYDDTVAPFQITINLTQNATHNLTVRATVPITTTPAGCQYGGYTLSTTRDKAGNPLTIVQTSGPTSTFTSTNTPTKTPTASSTCACITNTPTRTPTASPTSTPTPTLTKTNTPVSVTPNPTDPCASPTVLTGGGTFAISTTAKCFKYVNTTFTRGGMFSVMKDASATSDTLKWYGGLDQNVSACSNQTSTISGNGGQLNNFTVAKDANGQMFLTITGSAANNVTISIANWQNGTGCSVIPTVHP